MNHLRTPVYHFLINTGATLHVYIYLVIQKHFRTLEAIALEQPSAEEVNDLTVPDVERIERRAGSLLENFKQLVYTPDYDPEKGAKRKVNVNTITCA